LFIYKRNRNCITENNDNKNNNIFESMDQIEKEENKVILKNIIIHEKKKHIFKKNNGNIL